MQLSKASSFMKMLMFFPMLGLIGILVTSLAYSQQPPSSVVADEQDHNKILVSEHFKISFTSQLQPLRINQMHSWVIHLEDSSGNVINNAKFKLTGGMPDHDHGLPTEPRVTEYLGDGDYLLAGMKFHMSGRWTLDVVVEANGTRERVSYSFEL